VVTGWESVDPDVADLLSGSELDKLWRAARRRLESNGLSLYGTPLVLKRLSREEADAVAGLLGIVRPRSEVRIRLDALDVILRSSSAGHGLIEVLTALGGPLTDRRAEKNAAATRRATTWSELAAHPVVVADPGLEDWLANLRRSGLATRLAGAQGVEALVNGALDVVARLPGNGIGLAVLAAETTGDAHGLDRGRPIGTLVLQALGARSETPPPVTAGQWRAAWQAAGVVCDDLSCHVLVMNLRPRGAAELVGGMVLDHASFGEPVRLTLRQVSSGELEPETPTPIFCCENPAIVAAAADCLAEDAATLICLEGIPSTAGLVLLERLSAVGCPLHYHGDFDWPGLSIFTTLRRRFEVLPWRFGVVDYEEALDAGRGGIALAGRPVESSWDPPLAAAMSRAGVAVFEEQVVDRLLGDL
jgi:uncharacterized protein (TIGR02679 family)